MISQERFNEKMDELDRKNPEPLRKLLEANQVYDLDRFNQRATPTRPRSEHRKGTTTPWT
jgi:hypothetical protein